MSITAPEVQNLGQKLAAAGFSGLSKKCSGVPSSRMRPSSIKMTRSATWRAKPILVRHADHGGDVLLRELNHNVQDFLDHLRVERRGRFVKQDDGLLSAQGTGDGDALLLTTREILRILAGLMCHADALERGDGISVASSLPSFAA